MRGLHLQNLYKAACIIALKTLSHQEKYSTKTKIENVICVFTKWNALSINGLVVFSCINDNLKFKIALIVLLFLLQMPGLTKETCLALTQTCRAIAGLAKHLINFCGFNYVLLGKVQSDTLEGRFGHIRQLSGGNYYNSIRKLLESNRKLRAVSLLKHSGISVKISIDLLKHNRMKMVMIRNCY